MFNFFHNLGIGIVSAFVAFTAPFHQTTTPTVQPQIIQITASSSTTITPQVVAPVIIKKASTAIDNSNKVDLQAIKDKAEANAQAVIKAKADQDALVAKQKTDEQAKIDAQKAETDRVNAINTQKEKDAEITQQQNLINSALQAKQSKLDAINLKIANLNAKYAQDTKNIVNRSGGTTEQKSAELNAFRVEYDTNYNILMAEFQQAKYSN